MLHYVVCRECPTYMPDAADPGTGLCSAHRQVAALEARLAALEAECAELRAAAVDRFNDQSDWQCAFCLAWSKDSRDAVVHAADCIMAAPPSELGARIVKERDERRRLGDALATFLEDLAREERWDFANCGEHEPSGPVWIGPNDEHPADLAQVALDAWRALDRRDGEGK